tara:strand:+ start:198 stop:923 length:726 start_codon:yes stop_codon:yes gene_type:complete
MFSGQSHNVFKNFVKDEVFEQYGEDLGMVNPEDNGGEELIYLGAYRNSAFFDLTDQNNDIQVDLNNLNVVDGSGNAGLTGDVSLVLSAGVALDWDLTIADNIEVNSIFIFSVADQTLTINDQSVDLSSSNLIFDGINIETSPVGVCGYALPDDGEGCHTDRILGFNRQLLDEDGVEFDTNELLVNYLSDLTDLSVTSFSGSYIVDAFDIGIDSQAAVVPLPGTLVLYATALGLLTMRRKPD